VRRIVLWAGAVLRRWLAAPPPARVSDHGHLQVDVEFEVLDLEQSIVGRGLSGGNRHALPLDFRQGIRLHARLITVTNHLDLLFTGEGRHVLPAD